MKRTANIGVLSKEMALELRLHRADAAGSLDRTKGDPDWDLRKTEPYCGYETLRSSTCRCPPFDRRPAGRGDRRLLAPLLRPHARGRESIRIVEQAIDQYDALHAEGEQVKAELEARSRRCRRRDKKAEDAKLAELLKTKYSHRVEPPRTLTPGECYVETECPRGQMGFYVVGRPGKENVPLRVRARSSCFCNLSVAGEICKRLPDRRRARHRRQHRHRHGGDRPVRLSDASTFLFKDLRRMKKSEKVAEYGAFRRIRCI